MHRKFIALILAGLAATVLAVAATPAMADGSDATPTPTVLPTTNDTWWG